MSQSYLKGFTLVEILSIITIVSVLSVVIAPRLSLFSSNLNESKVRLINSLVIARQIAMFSAEQNTQIQFFLSNNTISIRKDNKDIKYLGIHYSDSLSNDIRHTPENLILSFNTLGETEKTNITLSSSNGRESVVIYSTGYVQ